MSFLRKQKSIQLFFLHKVAIDLLDPDNIAVITIENEKVAASYRQMFEALWK